MATVVVSLLLATLAKHLFCAATQSWHQSMSIHANEIKLVVLATRESGTFDCLDKEDTPEVTRAWFGPSELAEYDRCSDVVPEPSWLNVTSELRSGCVRHLEGGKKGCPVPKLTQMRRRRGGTRFKRPFWLVCYKCGNLSVTNDVNQVTATQRDRKGRSQDRYVFHPVQASADVKTTTTTPKSADNLEDHRERLLRARESESFAARKEMALEFTRQIFAAQVDTIVGRQGLLDDQTTAEAQQLLKFSETALGTLTNVLQDNETMILDVPQLGSVTLVRQDGNDGNAALANDKVVLSNEEALRNSDGSLVVSFCAFDKYVTEALGDNNVSQVIAVTAYDPEGRPRAGIQLEQGVSFSLQSPQVGACVWWDFDDAAWTTRGCRVTGRVGNVTSCTCSHLTNFAILLDISPGEFHNSALRLLTLVLCGVSSLALAGALIFFILLYRGNDRSDRVRINAHFCANLLAVQLVILFAVDRTENDALCSGFAMLLHYCLLTTFTWSLLSAHQIYVLLVQVFDDGDEDRRMHRYYCVGYGAPAIILGVSLAADAAFYGSDTYGTDVACWMSPNLNFILTFLLPLSLVLTVNLSMLTLAVVKVFRIRPRPHLFTQARGWLSLALLLGVTWAFGLLTKLFFPSSTFLAVSFVVLNSLQGLLIFVFNVVLSPTCRSRVRKEFTSRFHSDQISPTSKASAQQHKSTSEFSMH